MPDIEDLTYQYDPNRDQNLRHYGYRDDIKGTPRWFLYHTLKECVDDVNGKVSYIEPTYKLLTPPGAGPHVEQSMEGRTTEIYKRSLN